MGNMVSIDYIGQNPLCDVPSGRMGVYYMKKIFAVLFIAIVIAITIFITISVCNSDMPLWLKFLILR